MTWQLKVGFLALAAYLMGGLPFGLILGKLVKGIDIRTIGSGNTGATNLARACGPVWGFTAFALDFGKGFGPVVLFPWAAGLGPREAVACRLACGAAAVLGHVFSPYLRFRGGKGVATGAGVAAGILAPLEIGIAAGVWIAVRLASRNVGLASVVAAVAVPIAVAIRRAGEPWSQRGPMLGFAAAVAALVVLRHRANLRELIRSCRGGRGGAA